MNPASNAEATTCFICGEPALPRTHGFDPRCRLHHEPTFAARLKSIRQSASMTLVDLADASGVPRNTIAVLEMGRSDPSWRNACKLADGLGCKVDDFRGEP